MTGCNLCGSTAWKTLKAVGDTRVVCCACGLVFLTPQPGRAAIHENYSEQYYRPWEEQGQLRSKIWERRMTQVEAVVPKAGRLLDVGCGTGALLQLARQRGWQVAGTEVSDFACKKAEAGGVPVSKGEVWEAKFPENTFDVITCWHVLEHAAEPRRLLEECYRILRPGGWLFLATPNLHDYLFQAVYLITRGRRPSLYEPHERELHLYVFSQRTLRELVTTAQFRVTHIGFDQGAAAVWGKWAVEQLAYLWFRLTGLHWGMALELRALKPKVRQ